MSTVTGFTTINHRIRTELGLTNDEYALIDYLHSISKKGIIYPVPAEHSVTKVLGAEYNGFNLSLFLDRLCNKEVLLPLTDKSTQYQIELSPKWLNYFDIDAEFEKLWILWLKKGNKAKALKNYKTVRKTVPYETLLKAAEAYMASKKDSERQFIKGFEVWLNPANKHWEDVLVSPAVPKEPYKFVKN